jgi:hypothetical protein
MARPAARPDAAKTIRLIGDQHHGDNLPNRLQKYLNGVLDTGPLSPGAALTVGMGDITENGEPTVEVPLAQAWWAQIPSPKVLIPGNHDLVQATIDQWETTYGYPRQGYIDTAFCRFIWIYFGVFGATEKAAVQAMIDGTTLPCVIATHYPIRDSHQAGTVPHDGVTTATPYTYALGVSQNTNLVDLLNTNARLKGVLHGHTHAWPDVPRFAYVDSAGATKWFSLNTSAISYVGGTKEWASDPIMDLYLTQADGSGDVWEVRYRAQGAHIWTTPNPAAGKVTTLDVR